MFEEQLDVVKKINPESYNPTKVVRPNLEPEQQYEDTPEFRKSLNMKVHYHITLALYFVINCMFLNILVFITSITN